ncbi:MAG: hypothetical protein KAV00_09880, partial [Phycisphaerae bacterium]|nr:hypothetical protein [Phycisphaerae bacterium]
MGLRNKKKETLERLNAKTLDAKFLHEIQHGLNCSPFEAEAVLDVAKEVYLPFFDEQSVKTPPGRITLVAVSADEPASKQADHLLQTLRRRQIRRPGGTRDVSQPWRRGQLPGMTALGPAFMP